MKSIKKTMQTNGLLLSLNIDTEKLVENIKNRYKIAFDTLKKMVRSRERYIKKMHKELRCEKNSMRIFGVCVSIYKKLNAIYNIKIAEYEMLAAMYDLDEISTHRLMNYCRSIGISRPRVNSLNRLVERGYVARSDRKDSFYITIEGKNLVKSVVGAIKQDMTFYVKAKPKRGLPNYNFMQSEIKPKYTEEEIKRRREQYIRLMKPYWDAGYKRMPKTEYDRFRVLNEWVVVNERTGKKIHPDIYKWRENARIKARQP